MKPGSGAADARGKLLVALPSLPLAARGRPAGASHRLLRELARDWSLRLVWAAPSAGDRSYVAGLGARVEPAPGMVRAPWLDVCRRELSADDYAAVILVDHPRTREGLAPLAAHTPRPVVLVLLEADAPGRPESLLSRADFCGRAAEREAAAAQACVASQIWRIGAPAGGEGSYVERPRPERGWMTAALRDLASGARRRKAAVPASVIVPCHNGLRYTRECLAALARSTRVPYEVIVVDNGSCDGTAAFARRAPRARLIRNAENRGFAAAVNQGLRAARGRYIVVLNNDVVVTDGWLERLIGWAERAPWIGAVGPCTNATSGAQRVLAAPYRGTGPGLRHFAHAWHLGRRGQAEGVHRLTGFCLLLKRAAVERVGLFDERFKIGCYEEFDYCLRLRQAGYDLVVAKDVYVHHHGHRTFSSREAMVRQARANREVFIDKWCRQALGFLDELDTTELSWAGRRQRRRASAPA